MKHLNAFVDLVRIRYTGQVVGIVSLLTLKSRGITFQAMFTIFCFLFLCIALFAFDDVHDHESDRLVHPTRPIPKGLFKVNQVKIIGIVSFAFSFLFAIGLAFYQFLLFLLITVLGFSVIFLNLPSFIRAILTALMIFTLFPISISITLKSLLFGLIVALPHIGGSIMKDLLHSKGDEKIGLKPPSNQLKYSASFLFFLNAFIALLPNFLNLVNWFYGFLMIPTVISCIMLSRNILINQYQKVYSYGSIGMVSSLIAFAVNI